MPPHWLVTAKVGSIDSTLDGFSSHFVFIGGGAGTPTAPVSAPALEGAVHTFYTATYAGLPAGLQALMSMSLQSGPSAMLLETYDITGFEGGGPHGPPIHMSNASWTAPSPAGPMPEGVCGVLSYHSDFGSDEEFAPGGGGRPRQTHRNRTYIGPLLSNGFALDSTTQRTKLSTTFMNGVIAAFKALATTITVESVNWLLGQWSKKTARVLPVTGGWVDDRPDYQRRRSDQSAVRTVFTVP